MHYTSKRNHTRRSSPRGDLCIGSGITATTLPNTAKKHDPDHDPYGIRVAFSPETAASSGSATQQSMASQSIQPPKPSGPAPQGSVWHGRPTIQTSQTRAPSTTPPSPWTTSKIMAAVRSLTAALSASILLYGICDTSGSKGSNGTRCFF